MLHFTAANGQNISVCRAWCKFLFQDFYHSVEKDIENRQFVIYIKDKVTDLDGNITKVEDEIDLEYFKEYWGYPFKLMIMKTEKV